MATLKEKLEDNFVWLMLAAVFAAIIATAGIVAGTLVYFDARIEKRSSEIKSLIAPSITTAIQDASISKLLIDYQLQAITASEAARRQYEAAQAAQQNAEQTARALLRQADEMQAKLARLEGDLDIGSVNKRVRDAISEETFVKAVSRYLLPSGSVVSFDLSGGCPDGWDPFRQLVGRAIVGAGESTNVDDVGIPLTTRKQGEAGGRETYKLTVENVPQHQHATQAGVLAGNAIWGTGGSGLIVAGASMGNAFFSNTSPVGKQDPNAIPLMPPYLAMIYCKKS